MQPDMQEWPIDGGDAGGAKFLRSCQRPSDVLEAAGTFTQSNQARCPAASIISPQDAAKR